MYIITLSFTFHESRYDLENNNKLREGNYRLERSIIHVMIS